jgi:hypothetical protein
MILPIDWQIASDEFLEDALATLLKFPEEADQAAMIMRLLADRRAAEAADAEKVAEKIADFLTEFETVTLEPGERALAYLLWVTVTSASTQKIARATAEATKIANGMSADSIHRAKSHAAAAAGMEAFELDC